VGFHVFIDEVNVGVVNRDEPCDFDVSPGVHRVYVRIPRSSSGMSNPVDVNLAPGQTIKLDCRASLPIHKALARGLTMGAWKPQTLFLSQS
jgi:hypothetical protein